MARKHFGTDGVRGIANQKLTPELAFELGLAAGRHLVATGRRLRAVVGRDTRQSGSMLGAAVASGLCSAGVDVVTLGVAPTPTVSFIARTGDYGLGVIISASHNPAPDNGVKFVGPDGCKLTDEEEEVIEGLMPPWSDRPIGGQVGTIQADRSEIENYVRYLTSLVPERLDGMTVALDAAHGAAHDLGPRVLNLLGAKVIAIGVEPSGTNINAEGGATKPDTILAHTVAQHAHVGVAFDGDADRVIFSDDKGVLINGDRTLGIWAAHHQAQGDLVPAVVVGTVMSNGGFEAHLKERGITLERTPVGDKYVSQRITQTGALIGGEQSGHIIFPKRGPTGDGLITMLEILRVMRVEGRSSSSFSADYEPWPQLMVNVAVNSTAGWADKPAMKSVLEAAELELAGHGRMVVRASGTQPMIRVMVEADSYELRDRVTDDIVKVMQAELGGQIHGRVDLTHALGD